MKKTVALLTALVMLLSLCACSAPPSLSYTGSAEELNTLLDNIASIPIATMGVSAVITNRAIELLDWCEATSMSGDELAASVKAYYDALDDANKELFAEQIAATMNRIGHLLDEDLRVEMLESAGLSTARNWDVATFSLAASADELL